MIEFLPILLYPELHYHWGLLYPLYFRKLPEIIADVPYRIDVSGESSIPIMLTIKDAHKYPIIIDFLDIHVISQLENKCIYKEKVPIEKLFDTKFTSTIFTIQNKSLGIEQNVEIKISIAAHKPNKKKQFIFQNDNLPGLHTRLLTYLSASPLRKKENWFAGEAHYHSYYTDDQVEFGGDIKGAVELARRMNIDWFFVTDHSYDLDDAEDNYLKNDPAFSKWEKLKNEVTQLQHTENYPVFYGEELSCGNSEKKNVHFLIINNENFIPGYGDSAEKWFRNKPTHSIEEACKIANEYSLKIGAHTFEKNNNPVNTLLLNRGTWHEQDVKENRITYLQIINKKDQKHIAHAKKKWTELLLKGYKIIAIAGNDAHGYFNCKREVHIPFVSLSSSRDQVFGQCKIYIKTDRKVLTPDNFFSEFRKNRIVMSDGIFGSFTLNGQDIGSTIEEKDSFNCAIEILSSQEFGMINSIVLRAGYYGKQTEDTELQYEPKDVFAFCKTISIGNKRQDYFRLEVTSDKNSFCFTNPIWIKKNEILTENFK